MASPKKENWKTVEGFPDYEVSDAGRIRSLKGKTKSRIVKGNKLRKGYLLVGLRRDGRRHHRYVHRLVLEAFHGPCPDGMQCCHRDGKPDNNHKDNLRWDTPEANFLDTIRHGTAFIGRGMDHALAKLSEDDVRRIRNIYAKGSTKQSELALRFGVSQKQISVIINRHQWRHLD